MAERKLEKSIHTKLSRDDDYTAYLQLETLLGAQKPLSDPPHHDEMLFIIQHQVAELWMKLVIHEIGRAIYWIRQDAMPPAIKNLARVRHVQSQLYNQWKVLDTLTPSEYVEFRQVFGKASGFQSAQYRILEFVLGNKSRSLMKVYVEAVGRHAAVVAVLKTIYDDRHGYWQEYEMCEALMDIESNFQFWRFHHLKTVERIIGYKRGTGGSSGVPFLKKALDTEFFPELIRVRTEIGD